MFIIAPSILKIELMFLKNDFKVTKDKSLTNEKNKNMIVHINVLATLQVISLQNCIEIYLSRILQIIQYLFQYVLVIRDL